MGKHVFTVVVAVIIAVSLLIYMFAFQVRSNETSVVLTFGKPEAAIPSAGYHAKWPWPVQEVRRFDNRLHVNEGKLEETYTRDRYNVITSICVGWKIGERSEDVFKFNENFGRSKDAITAAWGRLETIVRDKTLAVLGQHDLRDLVSADEKQLKYESIEEEIVKGSDQVALSTYGIDVVLLKIRRLELPESVRQKVYGRMKADRSREAAKITEDAKQAADVIRANAEAQRDQILARAKSEADRIRGEGDAAAAGYYKVFAENPELAIYLRKIRALREATKNKSTIVVGTDTPPFDVLVAEPPAPKARSKVAAEAK